MVQQVSAGGGFTNSMKKLKKKSPINFVKDVRTMPISQSPSASAQYLGQLLREAIYDIVEVDHGQPVSTRGAFAVGSTTMITLPSAHLDGH